MTIDPHDEAAEGVLYPWLDSECSEETTDIPPDEDHDGDSRAMELVEMEDFAQDGDFANMEASEVL